MSLQSSTRIRWNSVWVEHITHFSCHRVRALTYQCSKKDSTEAILTPRYFRQAVTRNVMEWHPCLSVDWAYVVSYSYAIQMQIEGLGLQSCLLRFGFPPSLWSSFVTKAMSNALFSSLADSWYTSHPIAGVVDCISKCSRSTLDGRDRLDFEDTLSVLVLWGDDKNHRHSLILMTLTFIVVHLIAVGCHMITSSLATGLYSVSKVGTICLICVHRCTTKNKLLIAILQSAAWPVLSFCYLTTGDPEYFVCEKFCSWWSRFFRTRDICI